MALRMPTNVSSLWYNHLDAAKERDEGMEVINKTADFSTVFAIFPFFRRCYRELSLISLPIKH